MGVVVDWLNGLSVQGTLVLLIITFSISIVLLTTFIYNVFKVLGKLIYHIVRMIYIHRTVRKRDTKRRQR
jgi:hypothetical protein